MHSLRVPDASLTRRVRWLVAALIAGLGASTLMLHGQGSCGAQANPIVCENALPGNPPSQWDLSPSPLSPPFAATSGDNTIQGFATDISVNKGATVHFKVDTPTTFKVDIYRMGYYNGNGARLIATIPSVAGHSQPNCLTNSTTGLVDCGNWSETTSWAVPSTVVSGIYFAKLTRLDTGGSSHIFFIVRDDAGASDLLFQTSDTTWQAYNDYGGKSLYSGGPGTNPSRAYKVSYNRPFNTRGDSAQDFVFNAEYPMVRWLEANGFNVSYFSGVDTDRYASLLLTHRVFLSVGHDEYWSGQQRANVEAARGAGVNLAFLSGNEVFWKTRWESSIDGTSTPYRTLVSYKETHANAVIDPQDPPTWTGTWRDPRFSPPADGGRPENALTGTIFTVNESNASSDITVSQTYASQPFWRNTRVAKLAAGQSTTLAAQGLLGYEWDENLNNGFRPDGLTQLSSTTLSVPQKLQDYGSTYASGTATHALTLYRHASGALVFGAGTVQWSWGLDGNHDRNYSYPDVAVQQAMVNLFADMGVQPGSLQPGLVPGTSDTTPPTVSITAPAAGATVSGTTVTVSANASDNIGVAGVQFKLDGANLGAEDTVSPYSISWNTTGVSNGTHSLTATARDAAGNMTTSASVSVVVSNTPDTTPPTISMTAPANGATVSGSSVTVSATASDNVGVVGVQFLLDGVATGAEVTSAPYAVVWDTTATANGVHSVSARARDGAGNTTTATAVSVTVSNTPSTFAMDATAFGDRTAKGTTIATSAFSTSAPNELVLAFVATDNTSGTTTVTGVAGGSLTWQLVVRTNAQKGTSEVWRAFAATPLSSATVTATLSQSVSASITVVSFKGVDTSGSNGAGAVGATRSASANPGAPTAALTTTRAGSWVFGVGNDWDNAISRTLGSNQTLVHQFLSGVGDTYWVQRTNSPTPNAGTNVTINDTAPSGDRYNLSLVEVLPAANSDTTPPTVSISAPSNGSTVSGTTAVSATAADNIGVAGVQFKLDGANLGSEMTTGPYTLSWDSSTASNGGHSLTATARDAAGNTATSSPVAVTVSNVDTTPPTVVAVTPANGSTGIATSVAPTVRFSEAMNPATLTASTIYMTDSHSAVVPSSLAYNASTFTVTLTPTSSLANTAVYTVVVLGGSGGVADVAGNVAASTTSSSFTTAAALGCPCSIWTTSAVPARIEIDTNPQELGLKFTSDVAGQITAVRFYKGAQNTGVHTGTIWSATGTMLGTVTFTGETASGWQTATFATPIPILANTTYVVSYHTTVGYYGVTEPGLTAAVDSPPLHALADAASGGNGVYVLGNGGLFPNQTWDASNYWVDVVFTQ